jgi:transcriptional regulator with XRE-family HTH domain
MTNKIDFSMATSEQMRISLCGQIKNIRLARNITQAQLAGESGVSLRTIKKLEDGQGISLDTFIRVLIALRLQNNLKTLLPDPTVRPIERVNINGKERKRARPVQSINEDSPWAWGDESSDQK